jgi:electron-transferring-flavoprotein dehydrogenase
LTDEREQLEVDVLCVGAGPASLSTALRLAFLIEIHNRAVASGARTGEPLDPTILVVEKGREVGSHALSGAVVDPRAFEELLPDDADRPPYDCPVRGDSVHLLTESRRVRLPWTPPPLRNDGCFVASLGEIVRWMAGRCEERGIEVYPGFPAAELLIREGWVRGARIMDGGVGRDGRPKANYEAGPEVLAKVTVLGEGPRGTLTRQAVESLALAEGRQPQIYALGVKELWRAGSEIQPGLVEHTLGFPLESGEFGGGFLYTMRDNLISLGLVVGLDSPDPRTDAHLLLQRWKTHPWVRQWIEGGTLLSYGAKAIPEGGLHSAPKPFADGLLIVGDSAGYLNPQRLKGIHLAVKSGVLAAEAIFEALLADDFSAPRLAAYAASFDRSWARDELWRVRNFRQAFQRGFWRGAAHAAVQFVSGGRGLFDPFPIREGHRCMERRAAGAPEPDFEFDQVLSFDKLSSVYHSDTVHEEDQPSHLKVLDSSICITRCVEEYGNPCRHFCPAAVYEIASEGGGDRLQVNFSNCVHCKTCEIADPYQIILWTPPEGGGGPDWKKM